MTRREEIIKGAQIYDDPKRVKDLEAKLEIAVEALEGISMDNGCLVHGPGDPCDRNIALKALDKISKLDSK